MRRHGIRALAGRRFRPCTTDSRHDLPIAPNLLKQLFSAARPNTVWLTDITYLPTGEGWLDLAAVLDLATRRIVGWSMRDHMRTELTQAALRMANPRQRPGAGLICHSDRDSQYAADAYRKQLAGMKATPSMSRTGCCYDNAPMESFFHTLEVELVHQRRWATRDEGPTRPVRLHRELLQSAAHPLGPRLHHTRAGRAERELTPCPWNRGTISRADLSRSVFASINRHFGSDCRQRHARDLHRVQRPEPIREIQWRPEVRLRVHPGGIEAWRSWARGHHNRHLLSFERRDATVPGAGPDPIAGSAYDPAVVMPPFADLHPHYPPSRSFGGAKLVKIRAKCLEYMVGGEGLEPPTLSV